MDKCYNTNIHKFKNNKFFRKVVVITGASSGIGKACAIEFASRGAFIVLAARNLEKLKEVESIVKEKGTNAISVQTDVSDKDSCENLIDKSIESFGKIDILINNAGVSMRAKFLNLNIEVIEKLMNINFFGSVYCTKYALPHLLQSKGSIVAVSSISGFAPIPWRTGYAASKHAMNGFFNTLRLEHIKDKLHVLVVNPGFTASNIRSTALNKDGDTQKESPRDESKMMSSERVAYLIANAVKSKKREITLTSQGKILEWIYKRFPKFGDKLIYNELKKEPKSPS